MSEAAPPALDDLLAVRFFRTENRMDLTKAAKPIEQEANKKQPLAWKCSSDGKHYALFDHKKCRYCLPVYEQAELAKLRAR